MIEKALKFLEANELLHMSMIFPIKRGTVDILYADNDGVFLKEQKSNAYMLSSNTLELGKKLLDSVGQQELFCIHQKPLADYLIDKYCFKKYMTCLQAVYKQKEYMHNHSNSLDIRQLGVDYIDAIYSHYHNNVDQKYITRRIECGEIYGGFQNGELCGFIGTHEEGSIGLLEVFPQFRKRGFGTELESFMVNAILDKNQTPFAQISIYNEASIKLQKKMGFEISSDAIHWIF